MRTFDALIVGGGLIGSSIAFELAKSNLRVLVLDRQQPGQEASWAAAGMLAPAPETTEAISLVPLARASLELYPGFVHLVEELAEREVGFRQDPSLLLFFSEEAKRERDAVLELHGRLGLPTEAIAVEEARRLEPALSPAARAAVLLPNEGRVDNRALIEAVLAAARKLGAEIRPETAVTSLLLSGNRCTGVVAGGNAISAGNVVIAAGCFSGGLEQVRRYAPTTPVRGQMVALRSKTVRLGRVLRCERGYIVPRDDGRSIAGSTSENVGFEKRVTPAGIQQILGAALELVPELKAAEIVETWSGLRPDTPDHLPALGPTDIEGLLIATGHYRNGILLAPITAQLVREWICERRTSFSTDGFTPLRFLETRRRGAGVQ